MTSEHGLTTPPVRLCCGERHTGVVCPNGTVMCCVCFKSFLPTASTRYDVCPECVERGEVCVDG